MCCSLEVLEGKESSEQVNYVSSQAEHSRTGEVIKIGQEHEEVSSRARSGPDRHLANAGASARECERARGVSEPTRLAPASCARRTRTGVQHRQRRIKRYQILLVHFRGGGARPKRHGAPYVLKTYVWGVRAAEPGDVRDFLEF